MMDALLGNLPSTFAKDAEAVLAVSVRSNFTPRWTVADEVITVIAGAHTYTYDLTALTIGELAVAMAQDGFTIEEVGEGMSDLSARALPVATGSDNPIVLRVPTSLLWVLYRPIADELTRAETSGDDHVGQLHLPAAWGFWADFWGSYFGVIRRDGESDAAYAARIVYEVFRARNTTIAIQNGLSESLGFAVTIREPWRWMFELSRSRLSGRHAFPGSYYQYHILHPVSQDSVDWPAAVEEIDKLRPAGSVLWQYRNIMLPAAVDAALDYEVQFTSGRLHQRRAFVDTGRLSVDLSLSNYSVGLRVRGGRINTLQYTLEVFASDEDATWGALPWSESTWREYSSSTGDNVHYKHTSEAV